MMVNDLLFREVLFIVASRLFFYFFVVCFSLVLDLCSIILDHLFIISQLVEFKNTYFIRFENGKEFKKIIMLEVNESKTHCSTILEDFSLNHLYAYEDIVGFKLFNYLMMAKRWIEIYQLNCNIPCFLHFVSF